MEKFELPSKKSSEDKIAGKEEKILSDTESAKDEEEISKKKNEKINTTKILEEVESKFNENLEIEDISDEEFKKILNEVNNLSNVEFIDDKEYHSAREGMNTESEKTPLVTKEKIDFAEKIGTTMRGRLEGIKYALDTAKEHREEKKKKDIENKLHKTESKETEPKNSIEERIAELKKQEELANEQVAKLWKEHSELPSFKTFADWTNLFKELYGEGRYKETGARYKDAMNKANSIRQIIFEMEKNLRVYSNLKEGSSIAIENFQEVAKGKLDSIINGFKSKDGGYIAGAELTPEALKEIEVKLHINDAFAFDKERVEEIKKASIELSHQFEEQDIGKWTKVKLDIKPYNDEEEGWVRSFDREDGVIEISVKPNLLSISHNHKYDVRKISKITKMKESKIDKIKKRFL